MVLVVKNPPANAGDKMPVRFLSWENHLEKGMATHPVFLSGESQGQRSLAGYIPYGHKESDTTKVT